MLVRSLSFSPDDGIDAGEICVYEYVYEYGRRLPLTYSYTYSYTRISLFPKTGLVAYPKST